MNNENYKAPTTAVTDPPEPELPERPRNVNYALGLIGGGVLIQLLAALKYLQDTNFHFEQLRYYATSAAGLVLYMVICHQVARGRSWSRLLLLFITLYVFVQFCWGIGFVWRQMPEMRGSLVNAGFVITRVLPMVMSFIALHLLYYSSGEWFRRRE